MGNLFISKIHIKKCRHLENMDIVLSDSEKKHLILTGKNGSGKTSLVEQLYRCLDKAALNKEPLSMSHSGLTAFLGSQNIVELPDYTPFKSLNENRTSNFITHILLCLPAYRKLDMKIPKAIERVNLALKPSSKDFLTYMVFLRHQMTDSQFEGDTSQTEKLRNWFDNFQNVLRKAYNEPDLKISYERQHLSFVVEVPGREPFKLTEMADGYSSLLYIMAELMMRMEEKASMTYDMPGIVLIDEIETHLHVELQKLVLPFLTEMFPLIQFIVTTHSPFVISSTPNAVVYDLERQIRVEDMSAYSYEGVIEHFYDMNQYSVEARRQFEIYSSLVDKKSRTYDEGQQFIKALSYLQSVPDGAAQELVFTFRDMEAERRGIYTNGSIE